MLVTTGFEYNSNRLTYVYSANVNDYSKTRMQNININWCHDIFQICVTIATYFHV